MTNRRRPLSERITEVQQTERLRPDAASPVDVSGLMSKLTEEPRYETLTSIGSGGMGEVRLCRDRRIGRDVAMKVIQPGQGSESDARVRFLREAQVQGQLEHPAIVPVYDLGVSDDGPFFTMKRIRGLTLEEILAALADKDADAERAYPLRRRLSVLSTVCLAVAFAHARGVLHRDLKPSNIMVGAFGEVHVLDWGLAKLVASADDPGARTSHPLLRPTEPDSGVGATAVGELMGTAGYMAPEQARGDWDQVDERADVYALGAILFETLTLERLHEGKSLAELLASTIHGVDARPSARAPVLDVPPELEAICVRATATDPEDRFATAAELSAALERYLDGDRDEERREQMANAHAEAAEVAMARVLAGDEDEEVRRLALREAGAALALRPTHRDALSTLAKLLLTPPRELPAAVRDELAAHTRVVERSSRRATLAQYAAWVGFLPIVLWLGVRHWPLYLTASVLIIATTGLAFVTYRRDLGETAKFAGYVLGTLFVSLTTMMLGPFLLAPNLALTNLLAYCVYAGPRFRPAAMALAALALLVPFAAQEIGALPASYSFSDEGLLIRPIVCDLPELPTLLLLISATLSLILPPAVFTGRIHDAVTRSERRGFLERWSLRQMLPEDSELEASIPSSTGRSVPPPRVVERR